MVAVIVIPNALAAVDLLSRIIPTRPACLARLHALAVDHRRRRAVVATDPLAIGNHQSMVGLFEHTRILPRGKPPIDRLPGRKVVRQQPPGDPTAQHIEDGTDDLSQQSRKRPSREHGGRYAALGGYACAGWSSSTSQL